MNILYTAPYALKLNRGGTGYPIHYTPPDGDDGVDILAPNEVRTLDTGLRVKLPKGMKTVVKRNSRVCPRSLDIVPTEFGSAYKGTIYFNVRNATHDSILVDLAMPMAMVSFEQDLRPTLVPLNEEDFEMEIQKK